MGTIKMSTIRAEHQDAVKWQRKYEAAYQRTRSELDLRNARYYEGLARGFERIIMMAAS